MIHELDSVALTHDIEKYGLEHGDIGAVVHCYKDGLAFEVEFVTADGKTIAVLTLNQDAIRPLSSREIIHVRELAQAAS
jgi:hypothetical protein